MLYESRLECDQQQDRIGQLAESLVRECARSAAAAIEHRRDQVLIDAVLRWHVIYHDEDDLNDAVDAYLVIGRP